MTYRRGGFTVEMLMEAIKTISRSVDSANLEILEETHRRLREHFLSVAQAAGKESAAEQRILGVLWAELEIAVDELKARAENER